jgi:hypothetical protein
MFLYGRHDGTFIGDTGLSGLITQFTYEVVPEPNIATLLSVSSVILVSVSLLRKKG